MNFRIGNNLLNPANMKVRRQGFNVGSLIFMVLFGILFIGVGFLVLKTTSIDKSWTREQGIITATTSQIGGSNNTTTFHAVVEYKVNGSTYKTTSSTGTSAYPTIGAAKEIAYNPSQPEQAKVVESGAIKALILLFPVLGVLCVLVAPLLFIRSRRRSSAINTLKQTGQRLQGIISDIQTMGVNNTATYKIVVSAADMSGIVQTYVSDTLQGIGGLSMADFRTNPIPMDVYLDPMNPKNYYVDIADVPSLTPEKISSFIHAATGGQPTAPTGAMPQQSPPPDNLPLPPSPIN